MDILKLHTTGKEQIIQEINRLYSENKDKVCVYFDNGKLNIVSKYVIDIEREDNFPKSRKPLHLHDTYDIDGSEHAVTFRIAGYKDKVVIWIGVDNDSYDLDANLYLVENDFDLLDKNLLYDAQFFSAYEPILEHLFAEASKDSDTIIDLFTAILRLKESTILSFSWDDRFEYIYFINDEDAQYKRIESSNKYAALIIGDYIKSQTN